MHLGLVTVVASEYGPAISFFVDMLGFELVEDSPSLANDGRPKRWVVVRPPGAVTGLLLARADGQDQAAAAGKQTAGRVGFFLHVEDFAAACERRVSAGVQFLAAPRPEPYGRGVVFLGAAGSKRGSDRARTVTLTARKRNREGPSPPGGERPQRAALLPREVTLICRWWAAWVHLDATAVSRSFVGDAWQRMPVLGEDVEC